jgi:heme ABC exporter, ATP-binding protein CcmA
MTLAIRQISKSFGQHHVLNALDLELKPGELLCLLGRNGAGKTTLLRILAGLLKPETGSVWLNNHQIDYAESHARSNIGLVMHQPFLYEHLTGIENLRFYARLYQLTDDENTLETALAQVGMQHFGGKPVRAYSRGMKQRLTIARALLHSPRILLLDEPYTGLDLQGSQTFNQLMLEQKQQGCIILMTTHDLSHALPISSRFAFLARGRVSDELTNENLSLENLETWLAEKLAKPLSAQKRAVA